MGLELVTGYWGVEHVTAEQDADRNAGIVGSNCYVLPIGEQLRAEAVTSNMVRIFDGTGMAYGRQFYIEEGAYENITIENGTAGLLRNDLIVVKYKKDEASGIEGVSFEVLKGASAESATDPVANNADIRTGVFESEIPLYRVRLNGLAIEAVEPLFYVPKTVEALSKKCVELEKAVTELNGKLGLEIRQQDQYSSNFLTLIGKYYGANGKTGYGFTIRYGVSSFGEFKGDTYYLSVSSSGELSIGYQTNGNTDAVFVDIK